MIRPGYKIGGQVRVDTDSNDKNEEAWINPRLRAERSDSKYNGENGNKQSVVNRVFKEE